MTKEEYLDRLANALGPDYRVYRTEEVEGVWLSYAVADSFGGQSGSLFRLSQLPSGRWIERSVEDGSTMTSKSLERLIKRIASIYSEG